MLCFASLVEEVGQLEAMLSSLQQQLAGARGSLACLEESRAALEKAIACKTHSLLVDKDKCMPHRRRYPTVVMLAGYWYEMDKKNELVFVVIWVFIVLLWQDKYETLLLVFFFKL